MANTLLQRMWFSCRHQFSWPRRSDDGDYYQVCLECGAKYQYDWHAMRRTTLLDNNDASATVVARKTAYKCGTKKSWHPRDRRLRVEVRAQFREKGATGEWRSAKTENISRSGLLFTTHDELPPENSEIELVFLMPAEICGTADADVLCQARVVRIHESGSTQPAKIAVSISDFVYLAKAKVG